MCAINFVHIEFEEDFLELPFELPNAGLVSVVLYDVFDGGVGYGDGVGGEIYGGAHFFDYELSRDVFFGGQVESTDVDLFNTVQEDFINFGGVIVRENEEDFVEGEVDALEEAILEV